MPMQPTTGKSVGKPRRTTVSMPLATGAYHGEIGREATAIRIAALQRREAYHGEIGREATASSPADASGIKSLPRGNR